MANKKYDQIQKVEASTWCIDDPVVRKDKATREVIRYPLLKRQMGLEFLDTTEMVVWDIGVGPLGGVSSVVRAKEIVRIDPLAKEYSKYFNTNGYLPLQAEDLKDKLRVPGLIIVTNALDHFENPTQFLSDLNQYAKPGAFFAHFHAIDNAITHPHEAHVHNLNEEKMRTHLYQDWELCWYLNYQEHGLTYAWRKQPAFAQLWRKTKYD